MNWQPFFLSFQLSFVVTLLLFALALPFAWYLAFNRSRLKPGLEALCAMPIVLPPTVLGFYLLALFSLNSPLGQFLDTHLHIRLAFSFEGLVLASCFYSFPFMQQPLQSGFESIDKSLIDASYSMGKSKWQTLWLVLLPNMIPNIIAALVMTFAHTLGEFGVILMVGGSIPGETLVASIAIYEEVEKLRWDVAHQYSTLLVLFSFSALFCVYWARKQIGRTC